MFCHRLRAQITTIDLAATSPDASLLPLSTDESAVASWASDAVPALIGLVIGSRYPLWLPRACGRAHMLVVPLYAVTNHRSLVMKLACAVAANVVMCCRNTAYCLDQGGFHQFKTLSNLVAACCCSAWDALGAWRPPPCTLHCLTTRDVSADRHLMELNVPSLLVV